MCKMRLQLSIKFIRLPYKTLFCLSYVHSLLRDGPAPAARTARRPRPLCGGATGTATRCATPAGSTTNSTTWVLTTANTESDSEVVKWADSLYRFKRGKREAGDAKPAFPVRQSPLTVFLFRLIQLCFRGGRFRALFPGGAAGRESYSWYGVSYINSELSETRLFNVKLGGELFSRRINTIHLNETSETKEKRERVTAELVCV